MGRRLKLRMGQTVSSADAHVGDSVALKVLEEVRVGNIVVVPKGGIAMATVTTAQSKRNMDRGGKLDINIDYVKLSDGEKAALRAVKDAKGGGHTGAMTGAIVATSLIFFPAAPLFLFMKGKDITIPKGTEVAAFVSGDMPLDMARFQGPVVAPTSVASGVTELPAEAEIGLDGNFVGNTPSSVNMAAGDHTISIRMGWIRAVGSDHSHVRREGESCSYAVEGSRRRDSLVH
jgi:antitoxin (DNA-binding transcriptional repressor) of toxin-antitoxin stability system